MAGWTIGRTPGNDIIVSDQSVSRRHAELRDLGGGPYELSDLGSSNGTMLRTGSGWQRIESSEVFPDDAVRFGDYETTIARLLAAAGAYGGAGAGARDRQDGRRREAEQVPYREPVDVARAGGGVLEGMLPGLSPGLLRTAGILCFVLATLSVVFTALSFAGPAVASIGSLLQSLLGLAWVFILVVLKKQLNEAAGFHAADLPITLVAIAQLVIAAAGLVFAVLGIAGLGAAPGAATAMTAGLGVFAVVMLLLLIAYGGLMLWMGIMLLKAKDRLGGLYKGFAIMVIVSGGLFASVILTVLGGLALMATWVVLGILMLQWSSNPPQPAAALFD